jgi:hypothetical protein
VRLYDRLRRLADAVTDGFTRHDRRIDALDLQLSLLEERRTWEPIHLGQLPPMFGQWSKGSYALRLSEPVDASVIGAPVWSAVAAFPPETIILVLAASQILSLSAPAFRSSGSPW